MQATMTETEDRFLRRREVERLTGLSCAAIYRRMREGIFPESVKIGRGQVRWKLSDVRKWMEGLST